MKNTTNNLMIKVLSIIGIIVVILGFLMISMLKAKAQMVTVSGTVSIYQTSQPLSGVTITNNTTVVATTNESGYFAFGGPVGGVGVLTPSKEGYRFIPPSITTIPIPAEGLPNQNFSAILSVTDIVNIPTTAIANLSLNLSYGGNDCVPQNASFVFIDWAVADAGTTNATISYENYQYTLHTTDVGTVVLTATVVNGITIGENFTKNFTINIIDANLAISGNPVFGQTLTANHSNFSMWPYEIIKYGWKRNGTIINDDYLTINGGNSKTYTLTAEDIGKEITVTICVGGIYTNNGGTTPMLLTVIGSMTSNPTSPISKAAQTAPNAPTLQSKTPTSITLNTVEGCEYQKDNGNWQSSNVFNGLTPNTSYTFKQRKKETATHLASPPSNSATFKTDEQNGNIYTITASVNNADWGTIDPFGDAKVEEGGNITFTIAPKNGYMIENVLVNGVSKGAISTYTFTNVQSNGTISAVFKIGVGVTENEIGKITVYPNPTNGELKILGDVKPNLIEIFDNIGRKIVSIENTNSLNISHLSVGVYMVKIHTDIGIRTVKVVKE
jgi:hypothetical protein